MLNKNLIEQLMKGLEKSLTENPQSEKSLILLEKMENKLKNKNIKN